MSDDPADALYGLPLERFVPERDALVKALRADGQRDEAAVVAKLPKPSVAAWAVNQVVRTQPRAAAALWAAGDAVASAQADVVARRAPATDLRGAVDAEREALAPLADAARGLMTSAGKFLGEPAVEAVVETLHAAALDPAEREPVARGRVARPLRFAGIGGAVGGAAPTQPPRRAAPKEAAEAPDVEPGESAAGPKAAEPRRSSRARRGTAGEAAAVEGTDTAAVSGVEAPGPRGAGDGAKTPAESRAARAAAERERKAEEAERKRRVRSAEREVAAAGREVDASERAHDRAEQRVESARAALEEAEAARDEAAATLAEAEERLAAAREALDEATS